MDGGHATQCLLQEQLAPKILVMPRKLLLCSGQCCPVIIVDVVSYKLESSLVC